MSALTIEDRYPLQSQRGNFSGKASAIVKSIISGVWWKSDPTTGDVPDTMERNAQFHLNQGPVDMEIKNARPTHTPSTLDSESSLVGTYIHNTLPSRTYRERSGTSWREYFIWHVGSKPSTTPFSTIPTKF